MITQTWGASPTSTENFLNWLGLGKRIATFLTLDRHLVASTRISLKNITTNSLPPRPKFVENTYNLPLKRLFYQDDLVPLFLFYSWNTGFTFQDFRSIVKLSRHRYIMGGIYKAWYILWKKTLKITRVLLFHSERQMRLSRGFWRLIGQ